MSTFASYSLQPELVSALKKLGYVNPSPVQERIIPKALNGKSLVCQSETGSGKTHAYLIPLLEKIDFNLPRLQAIIVCPSRELARQVYDFAFAFTRFFPRFKCRLFTSENEKTQNASGLSIPPQLAIGTPGRLKDMLSDDYELDLHGVRSLVLDEADMLLELGYFEDIDAVYSKLPEKVQTMVFSATLEANLKLKLENYIGSDFLYEGEENKTAKNVAHHLIDVKHIDRYEALKTFLGIRNPYFCLVFASKKEDVKDVYGKLKADGYQVAMFSGDMDVRERKQAIRLIKDNRYQIVVCSDLLSRGIDLEDVTDVISIDLPSDLQYYYHRAGRTGRFDKKGDSWVFYNADSTARPLELMRQGVSFEFLSLKGDNLSVDPVGLAQKKKFTKKKAFSDEEIKEVKIAKAKTRSDRVKPAYKKKQKQAVERVKNKFRRKAIQKAVKKRKDERYAERARRKAERSSEE